MHTQYSNQVIDTGTLHINKEETKSYRVTKSGSLEEGAGKPVGAHLFPRRPSERKGLGTSVEATSCSTQAP